MTKEDLLPFIETDTDQFWLNSISPTNTDSVFLQHGIDDLNRALNVIRKTPTNLTIVNSFLKMNYLIKGEYFIGFMSNILLTNYRLFIWFSDIKKVIPLQKLLRYEDAKWDNGIKAEYLDGEAIQTFKLSYAWLLPETVNNALNKHKYSKLSTEELILANNFKPTLDSSYNILLENKLLSVEPVINTSSSQQITTNTAPEAQPNVNYNALFKLCLFLLFLGGCFYYYNKSDTSINSNISQSNSGRTLSSEPKSNDGSDTWIPEGYEKGSACRDCDGTGHYTHSFGTMVKEGDVCASCNGRGYLLRKK